MVVALVAADTLDALLQVNFQLAVAVDPSVVGFESVGGRNPACLQRSHRCPNAARLLTGFDTGGTPGAFRGLAHIDGRRDRYGRGLPFPRIGASQPSES